MGCDWSLPISLASPQQKSCCCWGTPCSQHRTSEILDGEQTRNKGEVPHCEVRSRQFFSHTSSHSHHKEFLCTTLLHRRPLLPSNQHAAATNPCTSLPIHICHPVPVLWLTPRPPGSKLKRDSRREHLQRSERFHVCSALASAKFVVDIEHGTTTSPLTSPPEPTDFTAQLLTHRLYNFCAQVGGLVFR